jgi:hypothetical protein
MQSVYLRRNRGRHSSIDIEAVVAFQNLLYTGAGLYTTLYPVTRPFSSSTARVYGSFELKCLVGL